MVSFSFKKKLLPSVMVVGLASGLAFSGSANAIHLAEDGIGQVLEAPLYVTEYGYKTKVSIVNTRSDTAVKAKVVLRSQTSCVEVLDFICYLTPSDVCEFEIRQEADGTAVMYSADDSIKSPLSTSTTGIDLVDSLDRSRATFGSVVPVTQPLFTWKIREGDTEKLGHIEIYGVYAVQGIVTGRTGANSPIDITIEQGMAKHALAQIFDTPRTTLEGTGSRNAPFESTERNDGDAAPWGPLSSSRIRSTDASWLQMTGNVEITSSDDRMSYRIPALAGEIGDNVGFPYTVPLGLPATAAVWDGLVVSNPRFDVQIGGLETTIGHNFGMDQFGNTNLDKVVEIEAALAANNLQQTFEDDSNTNVDGNRRTRLIVTFPTRYRHDDGDDGRGDQAVVVPSDPCGAGNVTRFDSYSPPFQRDGSVEYDLAAYDKFEHTLAITGSNVFSGGERTIIELGQLVEVNYFVPSWPETRFESDGSLATGTNDFRSGWFDMSLLGRAGCDPYYPGLPVISLTHKHLVTTSGSFIQSMLVPTTHKPVRSVNNNNATQSCPVIW